VVIEEAREKRFFSSGAISVGTVDVFCQRAFQSLRVGLQREGIPERHPRLFGDYIVWEIGEVIHFI
jgi:hypothetical protein